MMTVKRFMRSRLTLIVLFIVCTIVLYQTMHILTMASATDRNIRTLQSQIDESIKKRNALVQLQKLLQSDYFNEREARLKLGLKKHDEYVYVIPSAQKLNGDTASSVFSPDAAHTSETQTLRSMNPWLWWNYFFISK